MQPQQRWLMLALPLVFITFITRFPTGLVIYWVTTNLWTVGQGVITRRLVPKPEPPPKRTSRTPPRDGDEEGGEDGAKPPSPQPKPAAAGTGQPRRVKRKKKGRARR